jgi:arabinan endo-1,5-alpha-L-arabinosidase
MPPRFLLAAAAALALLPAGLFAQSNPVAQLEGEPYIHDPSTIVESDGRFYTFGTGQGGLVSVDGWTWTGGPVRPGGGVAPDVIKLGDRYFVAWAVGGGGMNGGHRSDVKIMWTKSLDPASKDFGFHEVGTVASSDGMENNDAIDPAFLLAEGRLWLSYGTYFGAIRMVELDPRTAERLPGNRPVDIAIDMEATALMYRDGWYYLLGTHGTCCDGPNSTYNIRVGRSRSPLGPYLDNFGVPLLKGGGKLVWGSNGRGMGAGHFGLVDLGDGVEKFSFHYEADLDRSGRSVLAILPLTWKDGWPVGNENLRPGTYEIQSERGGALQLAVDEVRMPFSWTGFGPPKEPVKPLAEQTLAQNGATWPTGEIPVDMGDYMVRPHQHWTIEPVPGAGGWFGAPYVKIVIAGTNRALAATPTGDVVAAPAFTGAKEQLWRIDQLTDGAFRIVPRNSPDPFHPLALAAVGASTPRLVRFDPASPAGRWSFRRP